MPKIRLRYWVILLVCFLLLLTFAVCFALSMKFHSSWWLHIMLMVNKAWSNLKKIVATFKNEPEVLIIDELWDTENTVKAVLDVLPHAKICTAFCKGPFPPNTVELCGLEPFPKVWLIGYGLDSEMQGRGHPHVAYKCCYPSWETKVDLFGDGLLANFI